MINVNYAGAILLLVEYVKEGSMSKILTYKGRRNNIIITVSLIVAIIITNSFIVFSPDEDSRSYFSNLTTTLTVAAPMVIAFVMVFRYKRSMKKQDEKYQEHSQQHTQGIQRYDNNKMHLSICIFLGTMVCCPCGLDLPVSAIFRCFNSGCILVHRIWIFWLFSV